MNCPKCKNEVKIEWSLCPYCGEAIPKNTTCSNCEKEIEAHWKVCPFCGAKQEAFQNDSGSINVKDSVIKEMHQTQTFQKSQDQHVHYHGNTPEIMEVTKKGEHCHLCGILLRDDYFICPSCQKKTCNNCRSVDKPLCRSCGIHESHNDLVSGCRWDTTEGDRTAQNGESFRLYIENAVNTRLSDWKQASELGIPEGQVLMGQCYEFGIGVVKDPIRAVQLYRKAVEQGYVMAKDFLGLCYLEGTGVPKDPIEAVRLFRELADHGDPWGEWHLAMSYFIGRGVKKDLKEAVVYMRKAAEQGITLAQNQLAANYCFGWGISPDYQESFRWFHKVAEQGQGEVLATALNWLGKYYSSGKGAKQDLGNAAQWYFEIIFRIKNSDSSVHKYCLGYCYENGIGTKPDLNSAIDCYRLAAEQDNEYAKKALERLIHRLPEVPPQQSEITEDAEAQFRAACKMVLADGKLTPEEEKQLISLAKSLGISKEDMKKLFNEEKETILRNRKKK